MTKIDMSLLVGHAQCMVEFVLDGGSTSIFRTGICIMSQ